MSEEQSVETNDGTWSGLKKTLIGTISTAILAGGTWLTTTLFNGGHDEKEETKTEQAAPAAAPVINLNVDNSSKNMANRRRYDYRNQRKNNRSRKSCTSQRRKES